MELPPGTPVEVMVRPDCVSITPRSDGQGRVQSRLFEGMHYLYGVALSSGDGAQPGDAHASVRDGGHGAGFAGAGPSSDVLLGRSVAVVRGASGDAGGVIGTPSRPHTTLEFPTHPSWSLFSGAAPPKPSPLPLHLCSAQGNHKGCPYRPGRCGTPLRPTPWGRSPQTPAPSPAASHRPLPRGEAGALRPSPPASSFDRLRTNGLSSVPAASAIGLPLTRRCVAASSWGRGGRGRVTNPPLR